MAKEKKTQKTKIATKKTKSAVKKISPKKTSPKKKSTTKKDLTRAQGEQAFWMINGAVLHDLIDLTEALTTMAEEHYIYHAEGDMNDFSLWVEQVLCDEECAKSLLKSKNKKGALAAVKKHLKVYNL